MKKIKRIVIYLIILPVRKKKIKENRHFQIEMVSEIAIKKENGSQKVVCQSVDFI